MNQYLRTEIEDCLETGIPDMALHDCHAVGVDSIVLATWNNDEGEKEGMWRVFVAWHDVHPLGRLFQDDGHFTIGVHNHRYYISITPLLGLVSNYEAREHFPHAMRQPLYEFDFTSAIREGGLGFQLRGYHDDLKLGHVSIQPGFTRHLDAEELHTVQIPRTDDPFTAWLVIEGPDRIESRVFSPLPEIPERTAKLYTPMPTITAEAVMEQVLGHMK
jgi:hypothetical protein